MVVSKALTPEVVEPTGLTDKHLDAVATLLRLDAVIYIPCAEAPELEQLHQLERALKGTIWTYLGPLTLHGPVKFYGKHRLRVEVKDA